MQPLWQDLRYGVRILLKNPGFTLIAIATLALGIGANTAIFSIVNALVFKPLPYRDSQRLMLLYQTGGMTGSAEGIDGWSYPKYQALLEQNQSFESVAAVSEREFNLTRVDEPERLKCEVVSANYFTTLGIQASLGRTFLPEEDLTPGGHPVALISDGLWRRRFGADSNVVGKSFALNQTPLTVIGVLPAGFRGQSGAAEIWAPLMMAPKLLEPDKLTAPFVFWLNVIARLKPGVAQAQAQAEMNSVAFNISAAIPLPPLPPGAKSKGRMEEGIRLEPLKEARTDPTVKSSFLLLLAAVGFVLLIACVNTANLLLARAVTRQKEIAVRLALGASRGRLMCQLLTEGVSLAILGGLVGLLIGVSCVNLLTNIQIEAGSGFWVGYSRMLKLNEVSLDGQVLFFNLALSCVTGVLCSLFPAIEASRPDVNIALKEGAVGLPESFRRLRGLSSRSALVVIEIALSFTLLIGAGLMIRSFARLNAVDLGFQPEGVTVFRVHSPGAKPAFYQQLRERVAALPGVESASIASGAPLWGYSSVTTMEIEGAPPGKLLFVGVNSVSPDYFKTLQAPMRIGRAFTENDRDGTNRVAIINETAARKFFPGESPVGKRISLGLGWAPPDKWAEIVGVVGDIKYEKVEEPVGPDVYLSYSQPGATASTILVRSQIDKASLIAAVRHEIVALDRNVPVQTIRTATERFAETTARTRFSALWLALFAGLALLLAAIGIYGVMSYGVSARIREIGVRIALGAQPGDVRRFIAGQGLKLVAIGLLIGLIAALLLTRLMKTLLFGVNATDPLTFIVIAAVLIIVALSACWIPARRATKVDPMIALRCD